MKLKRIVNLREKRATIDETKIHFESDEESISLHWEEMDGATSYNIYSTSSNTLLNKLPLKTRYYCSEKLAQAKAFTYQIGALNQSLVETLSESEIKAWTVYPTTGLFPIKMQGVTHSYKGSATTTDFNYDGKSEIVLMAHYDNAQKGHIVIVDNKGMDPFDIDGNVTTFSGYAQIPFLSAATPTVADIYGTGEPCIIALTRNKTLAENYIICYSSKDKNGDYIPDSLWTTKVNSSFYRSAVITDINSPDGKGEKEIIVRHDEGISQILILNCKGEILHSIGQGILNGHYGTPAVADLDEDGYKEIISADVSNLYIWNHDGNLRNDKVFFTESNKRRISSTPVICDFDADGEKEIIIASRTDPGYIYVIKQDGNCLPGFDGSSNSASIPYASPDHCGICHSVSVGDIDKDGKLEIVSLGTDYIRAWNNDGTLCFNRYLKGLFPSQTWSNNLTTPILADVDGDSSIDIVFHEGNLIYALNNQGNDIVGFPLKTIAPISNGLCIADIDNNGLNEIIVGDNVGFIYVWETPGKSSAIEWGRTHFDTENTSEYISGYKDQWVITNNTSWNGGTYPNDIIVRSGTFTIPAGVTLDMRKPYRIYVMDGGRLDVQGGSITNADIVVKSGGVLNVSQNSTITLRPTGGNLQVERGGTTYIPWGVIQ